MDIPFICPKYIVQVPPNTALPCVALSAFSSAALRLGLNVRLFLPLSAEACRPRDVACFSLLRTSWPDPAPRAPGASGSARPYKPGCKLCVVESFWRGRPRSWARPCSRAPPLSNAPPGRLRQAGPAAQASAVFGPEASQGGRGPWLSGTKISQGHP